MHREQLNLIAMGEK